MSEINFINLFKELIFVFADPTLYLFCFSLKFGLVIVIMMSFFTVSLDLICFSLLIVEMYTQITDFQTISSLIISGCESIHFPLSMALAASQKLGCTMFK